MACNLDRAAPPGERAIFGRAHVTTDIALFFSKLAVVTFGGAYSVLAYMAQQAVETYGWLSAGEMLDGLGLAETTPGPLILVTEFVGFLAGFRKGGEPALAFGLLGAAVTLWATFAPCFLWIFVGAPYVERLSANPRLAGALAGVTAAVVGVILNLSLWFALHVLFGSVTAVWHGPLRLWTPELASLNVEALLLSALAAAAPAQAAFRHREHARAHRRGRARLVARYRRDVRLARRPEIDEGRSHPGAVRTAINARERRRHPGAATRIDLGERRAHIGAVVVAPAALVVAGFLHESGARFGRGHHAGACRGRRRSADEKRKASGRETNREGSTDHCKFSLTKLPPPVR